MDYIVSAKRVLAVILGVIAILAGGILELIVVWTAIAKGQPRLLVNGIFPLWAVFMGVWGLRFGFDTKTTGNLPR